MLSCTGGSSWFRGFVVAFPRGQRARLLKVNRRNPWFALALERLEHHDESGGAELIRTDLARANGAALQRLVDERQRGGELAQRPGGATAHPAPVGATHHQAPKRTAGRRDGHQ